MLLYIWPAYATHVYEAMIDIICAQYYAPWRQQLCPRFKTNI